jgi:hypothetical protein
MPISISVSPIVPNLIGVFPYVGISIVPNSIGVSPFLLPEQRARLCPFYLLLFFFFVNKIPANKSDVMCAYAFVVYAQQTKHNSKIPLA